MSLISDRLREERKRLKKNQKEFAAMLGMADRTYWDRESGIAVPDVEFLAKLREIGVDIWYIITGDRMRLGVSQPRASAYTPAEKAAEQIRDLKLSKEDAEMLVAMAKRLSAD